MSWKLVGIMLHFALYIALCSANNIIRQHLGAGRSIAQISQSMLRIFNDCTTTSDELEFSIDMNLDLAGNEILLSDPLMTWNFEYQFKHWMNKAYKEEEVKFHSFKVDSSKGKRGGRRATATGACRKSHNCPPKPQYSYPNKLRGNSMSDFITILQRTKFDGPSFVYTLDTYKNKEKVTHQARFERETIGWSDLTYFAVSSDVNDHSVKNANTCKTSKIECENQRSAITTVFETLDIDYDESTHECSWEGVSCNSNNVINQIWIENSRSNEKGFPEEVTELKELTGLILRNNAMVGTIPKSLGSLTKLSILSLELNELTGEIPSELGLLSKMTHLNLSQNNFIGGIPSSIGDLKELEFLDMSRNNKLGGVIPVELGQLTMLKTLILHDANIHGEIPTTLKSLQKLQQLLLGGNSFAGDLVIFSHLTSLKVLDVANNEFIGSIPESFKNLKHLVDLYLYDNELNGQIPPFIGSLSDMNQLVLGKNNFSDDIPAEIGSLSELKVLDLGTNRLTGEIPSDFAKLNHIKVMNLSDNELTGEAHFLCDASFDAVVDVEEVEICP